MYVANFVSGMWVVVQYIAPTEDTPKSGHAQRAIVWTFFILSHLLVSPFTLVSRFVGNPSSPRMARKASVMQATPGCPVPIFFLFFFSLFLFSPIFFYFLAGGAKICNKIENGIIVVCVL